MITIITRTLTMTMITKTRTNEDHVKSKHEWMNEWIAKRKARGWSSFEVALSQNDHNMRCVPHLKLVRYHGNLKTIQPITMKNKVIFTIEKNGVWAPLHSWSSKWQRWEQKW
jgi:chitinase